MDKLSSSLEDYLEAIYNEIEKQGYAKVTEISNNLNVKKASVTGALNQLASKKLINYMPYSSITLTPEGEKIAKEILKRHEVMTNFLTDILGLSPEEAAENACKMEHIMSEKMFERMTQLSTFIKENTDIKSQIQKLYK